MKKEVDKYGYWGILVFVGIPLPFTGAWTGDARRLDTRHG